MSSSMLVVHRRPGFPDSRRSRCVGLRLARGKATTMTTHKHLKQLVRARMMKTGESYATARRHIVRQPAQPSADPATQWHFPGNVSATTALRILLAHAGVRAAHDGAPYSEAMLFGIAGGIGIGVFSFFYEKEGFASFYIAGRHLWQDDEQYFRAACTRFGIT